MKKFIFLLLSCISMLLFFSVFLVNAQEGENLNYSECNTFNYVGDVVNESHYNLDERNNEIVGDDGDESEKSVIFCNYNEMVRFNLASKPYCQPLSRFRLNGEIVYANNATKIENLFDAECDCFNPVVELTAIWDYEVYTITYHEKDINDNEKNIHKHIHISKC